MKISKLLAPVLALGLLLNVSCRNEEVIPELPKGAYENGILITNEGSWSQPNASVAFLSREMVQEENIFSSNNNDAILGNVFQTIGFKNDLAYLVLNVPNKVEIVDRYTFKKAKTITDQLDNPRYIAFNGDYTYITNNDFYSMRKVNIYDRSDNFVKSINFDRYAEKIVSSDNYIYVQTDGTKYVDGVPYPTGHEVSRINPATNTVDKVITLNDDYFILDMIADSKFVYVLTSNDTASNIYKISAATGQATQIPLTPAPDAQMLAMDQGKLYYLTASNKIFGLNGTTSTELFGFTANHAYGFNIIDGLVYISDPTFSTDSKSRIYNLNGELLKTLTTGVGTNGFYKN